MASKTGDSIENQAAISSLLWDVFSLANALL